MVYHVASSESNLGGKSDLAHSVTQKPSTILSTAATECLPGQSHRLEYKHAQELWPCSKSLSVILQSLNIQTIEKKEMEEKENN